MKIFLARASGAIGGQPFPHLVAGGHEAVGTTRSVAKTKVEPSPPADAEDGVAALRHLGEGVTP
jgi:hypothetical protein